MASQPACHGIKKRLATYLKHQIVTAPMSRSKLKHAVLICDSTTLPMIDANMTMGELNDLGVGLVVRLDFAREKLPTVCPIYFINSSQDSVRQVVEELRGMTTASMQYKLPAHLVFCGGLTTPQLNFIRDSNVVSKIAVMSEVYCDWKPAMERVFLTEIADDIPRIFFEKEDRVCDEVAAKLVAFCLAMGERPYIRYSTNSSKMASGAPWAKHLAELFASLLEDIGRKATQWHPAQNRATLLILDRTEDIVEPLVHHPHFEPMIYDALGVPNDVVNLENASGAIILSENDSMFQAVRLMHHQDALQKLMEFNKDVSARVRDTKARQQKLKDHHGDGGAAHAQGLAAQVIAVKEVTKERNLVLNYCKIGAALARIGKTRLRTLAELEHSFVNGFDPKGNPISDQAYIKLSDDMNKLIHSPDQRQEDKLRLLMLYRSVHGSLKDVQAETLKQLGVDRRQFATLTRNLDTLFTPRPARKGFRRQQSPLDVRHTQYLQSRLGEVSWPTDAYRPYLESILMQQLKNLLPSGSFPYHGDAPHVENVQEKIKYEKQRHRAKYRSPPVAAAKDPSSGAKLIVFVLGGITRGEIRSVYSLARARKVDIYIGSTSIQTPGSFVEALGRKR